MCFFNLSHYLCKMRMALKSILIPLLLIIPSLIFSQGELLTEDRVVTYDENSYGIFLSSNGFYGQYRYGKRLDGFRKRLFDIEIAHVKHPKEIRVQNPYYDNQKRFVFGKLNSVISIRPGIGLQKEKFSKYDKGGVSIKYFYSTGLTLALLKPVYYEVVDSIRIDPIKNRQVIHLGTKQFSSDYIHGIIDIYGRASYFRGIKETKLIPGLFYKMGISFEYSQSLQYLNALEAGFMVEVFPKKIPIMETEQNSFFMINIFLGYRFGKVNQRNY